MTQNQSTTRPSGTVAISNTGPLISVFQSDSFDLVTEIFTEVWISEVCRSELIRHGWADEIEAAGSKLTIVDLTADEEQKALSIAKQIAQHPDTKDAIAENHLGEAQVIIVAMRNEHQNDVLLLDELAARAIAKQQGVKLSGFPGVLLLAVQSGLISAEELKARLETCREQGTHYGVSLIQRVYEMARQSRR
ncbi:hypothetical protein KFU94_49750 [Chloroflexi bacterium TSY]|nr:hypothetical protein [Chloroflexi bacterium TSY]